MRQDDDRPVGVRIIERMLHEGFSAGDPGIVDELCGRDLIEHQFGLSGRGSEAIEKVKRGIAQVHRGMPDLVFTVRDWAERDGVVWVHAEASGTNSGPFLGEPTGRRVRFDVIDVARIVDGRIVEHWGVPDRFAILAQTGRLDSLRE